jgi:hypothetical protein
LQIVERIGYSQFNPEDVAYMILLFAAILILCTAGLGALHYLTRLNRVRAIAAGKTVTAFPPPHRYEPMVRLLSSEDAAAVAGNAVLARRLKKERVQIFRGYLKSLSSDYGCLLAAVRLSMVNSAIDRPDLAAALARNQTLFALAICRMEYRLLLTVLGIGTLDVTGLVKAISALQSQLRVFEPAMSAAA